LVITIQKYSKLFKTQDAREADLDSLTKLLMQFDNDDPLELMDKTIKRKLA